MTKLALKLYGKMLEAKQLLKNERGEANIVAIILILAIVIALAVLFRSSITSLFQNLWATITQDATSAV